MTRISTFSGRLTTAVLALCFPLFLFAQPPNDDIANAIEIDCGQTLSGTTVGATNDAAAAGSSFCGTSITAGGVWYTFISGGGSHTVSTCNQAAYDSKISVFYEDCATGFTCVGGNDDTTECLGFTSEFSFTGIAGARYYVLVHGFSFDQGTFNLTLLGTCTDTEASCCPNPGDLIITEIMANPASPISDANGEWFEVYNTTGADIDMQGLELQDNAGSHTVASSVVVPAGGYAVLSRNTDANNGGIGSDYVYGSSLALANGGDEVAIVCDGTDIDRVDYDAAGFPGTGGGNAGLSLSLDPGSFDETSNNSGANWCYGSAFYATNNFGTPGADNPVCNTPPNAVCQDITVDADYNCEGNAVAADFDGGSSDPDGDPLTFSVSPEGPYPLGTTGVTLTVDDGQTTSDCSATITVEDNTPPLVCGSSSAAASAYDDGWQSGDNDGEGFGPWGFVASTGDLSQAGFFIGNSTLNGDGDNNGDGDINTAERAWGIYANSGNQAQAIRNLSQDLTIGSTLKLKIDNGFVDGPPSNLSLQTYNTNGPAWYLRFDGGDSEYLTLNGNGVYYIGIPFTDEGLEIELTTISVNEIRATVRSLDPGAPAVYSAVVPLLNPGFIHHIRIANNNAGMDSPRDLFINDLMVCYADEDFCPDDMMVEAGPACMPAVEYSATLFDNCAGEVQAQFVPSSGSTFSVGTTAVFGVATDGNGNTVNCSFNVTVSDGTPPMAVCQDVTVELNASGQGSLTPDDIDGGSTDNCGIVSKTINTFPAVSLGCANVGQPNMVLLEVFDAAGNSHSCFAAVDVQDNMAPAAVCQDATIQLDADGHATLTPADIDGGSSDNCGLTDYGISHQIFGCSAESYALDFDGNDDHVRLPNNLTNGVGDFTFETWINYNDNRFWTRIFDFGNNSTFNLFLTPHAGRAPNIGRPRLAITTGGALAEEIVDSSIPMPSGWHHIAVTLDEDETSGNVVGTIYIDGVVVGTNSSMTLTPHDLGTTTQNYLGRSQYFDPYLRSQYDETRIWAEARTQGQIQDFMDRALSGDEPNLLAYYNYEEGPGSFALVDRSGSGNVGLLQNMDPTTDFVSSSIIPSVSGLGDHAVTLTVGDPSGNTASCNATVSVQDNIDPTITCPADDEVESDPGMCSVEYTVPQPLADDNCAVTVLRYRYRPADENCNNAGPWSPWTTDATVELAVGKWKIQWEARDASNNRKRCAFCVTVVDGEDPVAICPASFAVENDEGECGADVEFGIDVSDNCPGATVEANPPSGSFFPVGITTVNVTATDAAGNTDVCSFEVKVNDTEDPVVSCNGLNTTVPNDPGECEADVTLPVPPAMDNCEVIALEYRYRPVSQNNNNNLGPWQNAWTDQADNDLTLEVGRYRVRWRATDAAGNTDFCRYFFEVEDVEPPIITCTNSEVVFNGEEYIDLYVPDLATATDNCGVASVELDINRIFCDELGDQLTITATATDVNGLTSTCTSKVDVKGLPCGWSQQPDGVGCEDGNEVSYSVPLDEFTVESTDCHNPVTTDVDEYAFAQYTLCGDGMITAQVASITGTAGGWAGVTMRGSNDPYDQMVSLMTNLGSQHRTEIRQTYGGNVTSGMSPSFNRHWLRIQRIGNNFRGFVSFNGVSWFTKFNIYVPMDECIEIGLIVNSSASSGDNTATFANVDVVGGPFFAMLEEQPTQQQIETARKFSLYPNPSSGRVTIELGDFLEQEGRLEVVNLNGEQVRSWPTEFIEQSTREIDLSDLPGGVYFLRLQLADGEVQTQRLILQPRP